MNKITPENKIKKTILLSVDELKDMQMDTNEQIVQVWKSASIGQYKNTLEYATNTIRGSGTDTKLACSDSFHFESKAVAAEMFDGTWIGWTYWFGGGKYGEPDTIAWMEHAYPVTFTEQTIVVKKFKKV